MKNNGILQMPEELSFSRFRYDFCHKLQRLTCMSGSQAVPGQPWGSSEKDGRHNPGPQEGVLVYALFHIAFVPGCCQKCGYRDKTPASSQRDQKIGVGAS